MQKLAHQTRSFDGFTLDLTRGCLLRGDEELKLRAKSFDVLKYLVENSSRLVSKDELIGAVWRDTFVTDNSLVQCLIGRSLIHTLFYEQSVGITEQEIKILYFSARLGVSVVTFLRINSPPRRRVRRGDAEEDLIPTHCFSRVAERRRCSLINR